MIINKEDLRKTIQIIKKKHTTEQLQWKSKIISIKIENNKVFQNSCNIAIYWPLHKEVDLRELILKYFKNKNIYLPFVLGENIGLKKFEGPDNLKEGTYGIMEPNGIEFTNYSLLNLVIVPGIAFDKNGNRLGRGKGYYDKLLSTINAYKIGVCFDFQLVNTLPVDDNDIPVDEVVFG